METTNAVFGNRRNQLIAFGAIGGLFIGCTSNMAESAEFLIRNQHALHAIIPIGCFAISNFILVALWKNRDRMRPTLAVLATILLVTLFVVSLLSFVAVKDSDDALKTLPWPTPNFLTTFVCSLLPLTVFGGLLTNFYSETRSLRAAETTRSQTGAT